MLVLAQIGESIRVGIRAAIGRQRVQGIRDLPVIRHAVIVSVRLGRIRVGHARVVGRAIIIEAAFVIVRQRVTIGILGGRVRTAD